MSDDVLFHCETCYNRQKADPDALRRRNETTKLFREKGVFLVAICNRCGGIIKPYLKHIDEEDL